MTIQTLTPIQLQQWRQQHPNTILLDVRENSEVAICQISGSLHIPMKYIPIRHNELPDDKPIVVYCHHGIRSLNVAHYLNHIGFEHIYNLSGGINAWANEIDPQMPRY